MATDADKLQQMQEALEKEKEKSKSNLMKLMDSKKESKELMKQKEALQAELDELRSSGAGAVGATAAPAPGLSTEERATAFEEGRAAAAAQAATALAEAVAAARKEADEYYEAELNELRSSGADAEGATAAPAPGLAWQRRLALPLPVGQERPVPVRRLERAQQEGCPAPARDSGVRAGRPWRLPWVSTRRGVLFGSSYYYEFGMCGCFVAPEGPLGFAFPLSSDRATMYKWL